MTLLFFPRLEHLHVLNSTPICSRTFHDILLYHITNESFMAHDQGVTNGRLQSTSYSINFTRQ